MCNGYGGGVYCGGNSAPTFVGCAITRNGARELDSSLSTRNSGGLYSASGSTLLLKNCIVSNNGSGGLYCDSSSLRLENCTLVGNSSGSALYGDNLTTSTSIDNCIFWNNTNNEIILLGENSIPVSYCLLDQSKTIGISLNSTNIIDGRDPLFVDAANGNYHLQSVAGYWDGASSSWVTDSVHSPCIDAGDLSSNFTLEPFPSGGRINMGAYGNTAEASKAGLSLLVWPEDISILEGSSSSFMVSLSADPVASTVVDVSALAGSDADLYIISGSSLTFTSTDWWVVQEVIVGAMEDDADGIFDAGTYRLTAIGVNDFDVPVSVIDDESYVNGVSGNDAYDGQSPVFDGVHGPRRTIQAAIDAALDNHTIEVAPGAYVGGINFNDKDIKLTSIDPGDPAIVSSTIIDGDGTTWHKPMVRITNNAELSGFTVRNGATAGGVSVSGSPVISDCVISGNSAGGHGGGVYLNSSSSASLLNCVISGNSSDRDGGGVYLDYGTTATLESCIINGNFSKNKGGGVFANGSNLLSLKSCIISNNSGGGLYCSFSPLVLIECVFKV